MSDESLCMAGGGRVGADMGSCQDGGDMSKPAPAGYRPSGSQCAQCQHAARDCSSTDFSAMRPAGKPDSDWVQRVACSGYVRAAECSECGQRGWHKLSCGQRTDRALKIPATRDAGGVVTVCQRPCRCGPDGCADSVACPRSSK